MWAIQYGRRTYGGRNWDALWAVNHGRASLNSIRFVLDSYVPPLNKTDGFVVTMKPNVLQPGC